MDHQLQRQVRLFLQIFVQFLSVTPQVHLTLYRFVHSCALTSAPPCTSSMELNGTQWNSIVTSSALLVSTKNVCMASDKPSGAPSIALTRVSLSARSSKMSNASFLSPYRAS